MAVDLERLRLQVGRAYERGRVRHAFAGAGPLLALATLVASLQPAPLVVLGVGVVLFASGVVLLWRGQQLGRGAWVGASAGLIPLGFGICVRAYQHWCQGSMFMPGCVAACAAGGVVAGVWIALVAKQEVTKVAFVASAAGVALLTGALGCSCAGPLGVGGMLVGLLVPFGWLLIQRAGAKSERGGHGVPPSGPDERR
jgi:hypothetical protein